MERLLTRRVAAGPYRGPIFGLSSRSISAGRCPLPTSFGPFELDEDARGLTLRRAPPQHLVGDVALFVPRRMAAVHEVEHEIGVGHLGERAAERRHEVVRQFADEPHRVGQQHHPAPRAEMRLAQTRIEGREETVLGEDAGAGEAVEELSLIHI